MAITKIRLGTKDDGSALYHYASDGHVVLTGPITGVVRTSDGTSYAVNDEVIEVDSEAHAAEVALLIGQRYADEGHPSHGDGTPFVADDRAPEALLSKDGA